MANPIILARNIVATLEAGVTYDADIYTSDGGAKYINSAKLVDSVKPVAEAPKKVLPVSKASPVSAYSTGRDFDKEARGKTKCALYEAVLSGPLLTIVADDEEFKARADALVSHFFDRVFDK